MAGLGIGTIVLLGIIFSVVASSVRILQEYERGVVFRLGRALPQPKGPGIVFLIPFVDKIFKVSIRTITMDIEPQDVITRDNVSVKVNAVLYFRVIDAIKAVINIENYLYATTQLAQTHLRSILGQHSLDQLLIERDTINEKIQEILDQNTDVWGIKVSAVEIKHIDLPPDMQRAMAREAESERERRAKIIAAEGEAQASKRLREAADEIASNPTTLQLRYLQTLAQISTQNSSTIIFPLPMDMLSAFLGRGTDGKNIRRTDQE